MAIIGDDVNGNIRPLMSVVFRRLTIDTAVVFGNKEDESVVEGGVIIPHRRRTQNIIS